jgi:hypothetical protein
MSERTQRALWIVMALVAVGLSMATGWLCVKSRQTRSAVQPYRIVYTSMQQEDRAALLSINMQGGDAQHLSTGDVFEAWPASASPAVGVTETARIAYIRIDLHASDWGDFSVPGGIYAVRFAKTKCAVLVEVSLCW